MTGAEGAMRTINSRLQAELSLAAHRYRRQDVYDIAYLAERFPPDEGEKATILEAFQDKCAARSIVSTINSISKPDVNVRARSEWDTLHQEIGEVPDFDECFAKVEKIV